MKIKEMISAKQIDEKISELAARINKDYEGQELVIICILKGSMFFTCDLARKLTMPLRIDTMKCSSYNNGTVSSGEIKISLDLADSIKGKNVLVVEDIIDSGNTLSYLLKNLEEREPSSVKLAALLNKPERREVEVFVDYVGFTIPDKFVVGYGLDYAEQFRELPYIGEVELEGEI